MNRKTLITIVVVVLLLGGAATAYFVNKDDGNNNHQSENTQQTSQQENGGEQTSLKSLLGQNRNITCTYSGTDEAGNQNSGTVYIAGERMRGNFVLVDSESKQTKSNMIQDGTYMYLWEEDSNDGIRYDISKFQAGEEGENEQQNQGIDQDQQFNFDCQDWTVDESKFQVPENVNFADLSAQLEQSQQQIQAACTAITDPSARAACENAAQ